MNGKYVSFNLGGVDYCVAVESVRQIISQGNILETPKAHPSIKGVISLRGDVIPVVDLRARLGLPAETSWRKRRIIVVEYGRSSYGLLVDEVHDIVELEARGGIGISRTEPGRKFSIIDLSGVFSVGKAEHTQEAAT